jgi:hypothetical protein
MRAVFASVILVTACGGGTPEPEAPVAEETPAKADAPAADDSSADSESAEPSEPEPAAPSGPNPKEVLLRDEAVFVVNYTESDMGKKQEEKCEKSAKGDPAKKNKCMSAALKRVTREGFQFEKDEDGETIFYIRFAIVKEKRVVWNKVKAEIGEPKGKKVTITTSGADKAAMRKGKVPAEFELTVEDEYTIVVEDEDKGRIVYETRLGLFAEAEK